MNPQPLKHHFIVVHFGDPEVTTKCLKSLLQNHQNIGHIIIVDNDNVPYKIPLHSDITTVIRPKENQGYGAAGTLGLGVLASKGIKPHDYIIIMNNDIILKSLNISPLQKGWDAEKKIGIHGVQAGMVNIINGRATLISKGATLPAKQWNTLPYLDGALLAATYATWAQLKGLPTEYFLYWEDVALSIIARKHHIPLKVASTITIEHGRDHRRNPSSQEIYYLVRNGAYVLAHFTPLPWQIYWRLRNAMRLMYHGHLSRSSRAKEITAALFDAAKGKLGKNPAV